MHKNIKELIEYPKGGILSKEIVKNAQLNITSFCLAAGTEISEHTSTMQGFVYVIEGDGVFDLAGEKIPMSAGVFIYLEKNIKHSLKADSNTSFILTLSNTE